MSDIVRSVTFTACIDGVMSSLRHSTVADSSKPLPLPLADNKLTNIKISDVTLNWGVITPNEVCGNILEVKVCI